MNEFPQIRAYWFQQENETPAGWYAQELNLNGEVVTDSLKVSFPVDVDEFKITEGQALAQALGDAYPEHEIYVEDTREWR